MESREKAKIKKTLSSLLGQSAEGLFPDLFKKKSAEEEVRIESHLVVPAERIVPSADFFARLHSDGQAESAEGVVPPPEDTGWQTDAAPSERNEPTKRRGRKRDRQADTTPEERSEPAATAPYKVIAPPPPPDTSWLATATLDGRQEEADDAPHALLALSGRTQQELIAEKLPGMGYAVTTASSAAQALELLDLTTYPLVFCSEDAAFRVVRRFVDQLPTDRRRHIYFVLVGDDLHTYHDLEALAFSANLVINTRDLPNLELILPKGLHDYEQLFRPLLDLLDTAAYLK